MKKLTKGSTLVYSNERVKITMVGYALYYAERLDGILKGTWLTIPKDLINN